MNVVRIRDYTFANDLLKFNHQLKSPEVREMILQVAQNNFHQKSLLLSQRESSLKIAES